MRPGWKELLLQNPKIAMTITQKVEKSNSNLYKLAYLQVINTKKEVNMRTTKGQAAMEFLMTYGWAILAAIIVIGILGYLGFSSGILSPSASIARAPFHLNVANVNTSTVNLELKNNGADDVSIYSVAVSGCGTYTGVPDALAAGAMDVYNIVCAAPLTGTTFKGDLIITYRKPNSQLDSKSTGSVKEPIA
jgi:hypothetical protein